MEKARKSLILKVLIQLLMPLIIILGFNTYAQIIYNSPFKGLKSVEESAPFQSMYLKYVERVAEYIQYCERGFETKLINDTDYSLQGSEDLYQIDSEDYNQNIFDFYHKKLNIDQTNFLYYVINTTTGEEFYSPYFYSMNYSSVDTIEPDLLDSNLKHFVENIKNYKSYLTLNTETGVYGTNVKDNTYINASNLGWVANCITQKLSKEDFNNKVTYPYGKEGYTITPTNDSTSQVLQSHKTGTVDTSALKENQQYQTADSTPEQNYLIYTATLDTPIYAGDDFLVYQQQFNYYKASLILLPAGIIFFVLLFFFSICLCGYSKKQEGIRLNFFDKIYTEIAAAIIIILLLLPFYLLLQGYGRWIDGFGGVLYGGYLLLTRSSIVINIIILCLYCLAMFGLYSLIRRIKAKTIFTNSVIYIAGKKFSSICKIFIQHRNLTFITVVLFIAFTALNIVLLLLFANNNNIIILGLLLVLYIGVGFALVKLSADLNFILQESKKIMDGDLNHHIPSENLSGPFANLGNYINNISSGLSNAVEEKLKSERLKTELITNVSHDIKTPLTSIINYVDLLKKQPLDNPVAEGYLEVLETKSWRLKTLIEDLVEASKASTGTIPLNLERLNIIELIRQSMGEFEDRFINRKLEPILNVSDEPIYILADGRSTFRIIENVFSNVNKYALSNTRIYIDAIKHDNLVTISVKNISAEKLNITSDELMERFVRGDMSRNTEGSGLGLSIAKSLASLQNGTFDIILDGDLFKASFTFNVID